MLGTITHRQSFYWELTVYATNAQLLADYVKMYTALRDILPSSTSANTRFLVEWRLQAVLMAGFNARLKVDQTKQNYRNDKTGLYKRYFRGYFFTEFNRLEALS